MKPVHLIAPVIALAIAAGLVGAQRQTAAQWAVTLPPGETRKETLDAVYKSWPQDDPASKAAREAFMENHPAE